MHCFAGFIVSRKKSFYCVCFNKTNCQRKKIEFCIRCLKQEIQKERSRSNHLKIARLLLKTHACRGVLEQIKLTKINTDSTVALNGSILGYAKIKLMDCDKFDLKYHFALP